MGGFTVFFGMTNTTLGVLVMVVLMAPLAAVIAIVAARIFATHAAGDRTRA